MLEVIKDEPECETTQKDDKNQDLSRFSAHGKKTLARIATALGEEQGKFLERASFNHPWANAAYMCCRHGNTI